MVAAADVDNDCTDTATFFCIFVFFVSLLFGFSQAVRQAGNIVWQQQLYLV